jgi:hypothetical protein
MLTSKPMYKENMLWSSLLFPPSKAPKLRTSQLVAYFRCPFSLAYASTSYGCCCSSYSYSIRVEEKEVVVTQKHKKPASKRNPRTQSQEKFAAFNIK